MNIKMSWIHFFRSTRLVAVLGAILFSVLTLRSQPAERAVQSRFLFIFDTSSNMKKREPAVEKAVNTMLATSLNGQLHKGDTIGVRTFSQELNPGDFSLQTWQPENAVFIASNLTKFVRNRKYAGPTRFEALQPLLNGVVAGSERLTVLIFSDGATKITGTTFDTGINQLFEQNTAAQKKAHEPFVVVLRSQQGKYVGCTVSYPPQLISYPQFPPLPALPEPPTAPKPAPAPLPASVVATASMFITGTNVENRLASPALKPAPTNPPPVIEPAPASVAPASTPIIVPEVPPVLPATAKPVEAANTPVIVPVTPTNPLVTAPGNPPVPAPVPVEIPTTNPIVPAINTAVVPAANPVVPAHVSAPVLTTNRVAAKVSPSGGMDKKPLIIGAICLLAAGVLTVLGVFFFRRPDRRSLISRSMHDK